MELRDKIFSMLVKSTDERLNRSVSPKTYRNAVRRLVVIGDLHGDIDITIKSLLAARVMNNEFKWIGGDTVVVQAGDQLDRVRPLEDLSSGEYSLKEESYKDEGSYLKILYLLNNLNRQAKKKGGEIINILGNHEMMNVNLDFRYVSDAEFNEFYLTFKDKNILRDRPVNHIKDDFKEIKNGLLERASVFYPGGTISNYFATHFLPIVQIGKFVICHAGILPKLAKEYTLKEINHKVRDYLLGDRKDQTLDFIDNFLEEDDLSTLWTREYGEDEVDCSILDETLSELNKKNTEKTERIESMIVGHSPQFYNNEGINYRCDGKIFRVDVGMSKAFHFTLDETIQNQYRKVKVLEILDNGREINILGVPNMLN